MPGDVSCGAWSCGCVGVDIVVAADTGTLPLGPCNEPAICFNDGMSSFAESVRERGMLGSCCRGEIAGRGGVKHSGCLRLEKSGAAVSCLLFSRPFIWKQTWPQADKSSEGIYDSFRFYDSTGAF